MTERFSFAASSASLRLNSGDTRRFNVAVLVIAGRSSGYLGMLLNAKDSRQYTSGFACYVLLVALHIREANAANGSAQKKSEGRAEQMGIWARSHCITNFGNVLPGVSVLFINRGPLILKPELVCHTCWPIETVASQALPWDRSPRSARAL